MDGPLELTTIEAELDHPEAVAWGPDGRVYAGGEAGQLYRVDLADGSCEEFANTGGFVLGLALDADANVYACDGGRQEIVKVTPDGTVSTYANGSSDRSMSVPNYPVFDDGGNLYVSDSGGWGERDGVIWRVTREGDTSVWDASANGFTNGMCLSRDGRSMYVVESSPPLISRVKIRGDGTARERSVVVELPRTVPDGIALDVEGALIISLYNPNIIYRYTSVDGELTVLYDDWEQLKLIAPTNVAFGGRDLRTLIIASLCGWNINTAKMAVAGLPLRYPKVT